MAQLEHRRVRWAWMGSLTALSVALAGCPRSHSSTRWDCAGSPCDDGDACNGVELCEPDRGCVAGQPIRCDDDNPCTDDSCDGGECSHAARDLDADGYADPCAGGDDCAPEDPTTHPGAEEACNERDDDCDLEIDEGFALEQLETQSWSGWGSPLAASSEGWLVGWDGGQLLAQRGGETVVLTEEPEGDVPLPRWCAAMADMGRVWVARVGGDLLTSPFGDKCSAPEIIRTALISFAPDPIVDEIRDFARPPPWRARARSPAVAAVSGSPTLAWLDFDPPSWSVFAAPIGEPVEPRVIAAAQELPDRPQLWLLPDRTGTTAVWTEPADEGQTSVRAARIGSDDTPLATVEAFRGGAQSVSACALARGGLVAVLNDDGPGSLEGVRLDETLGVESVDLGERVDGADTVALRCVGDTAFLLQSNPWIDWPDGERLPLGRLDRLGASPTEAAVDGSATLIAAESLWIVTRPDDEAPLWVAERWGCRP